ncbi:phosphoglycerol transferase MdoB-like AlkP superfamily enzyme [Flavobacterium nitrogenifigens]|uniref:Phosphoglycerol transferase MdoB-like AlkP superfamily enzyme n=2 Tax=Flavobacterium TaxID=237 RepID=A0A7W7IYF4_9FLAO|nr:MULTISPECIES: Pr6Pr family membrane protein [Flavobacterium]MBB4802588.1 phosphoglycerol transferase MdoB-like AlkP superfamily enzyme [Flavobacterium nitrogenifigens]MBB6387546.1 phosphoglycerol transferase MdoB-like AlkP superfamily enzyme [Flavobacterium notoginsengisoli]
MKNVNYNKILGVTIAIFTWLCIVFQFYISANKFIDTISYFTILSNLLVTISLSFSIFLPRTKLGVYFSNRSVQTALALYILIVGLIYNLILRELIKPLGWQLFLDNMLHVTTPILYLLYWLLFDTKEKLNWKNGVSWLLFPIIYLVYSLIRGAITDWYPYPFLAVSHYGYSTVILNALIITLLFYIVGTVLIFVNNKRFTNF